MNVTIMPSCAHRCCNGGVPITVYPGDAAVHIGLSYNFYRFLDASVVKLSNCTSLSGPLAQGADHECECQSGTSGRYVYVYMQGRSGVSQLDIWEAQLYGSK